MKVKIMNLKIDEKLVKLRHVNPVFVSRYRQAYRNDAQLPLIVVQKGTNRIVSGNHRFSALKLEYGEDHEIEVIERVYKTELEILKEFTRENATHGNALDDFSKKKLTFALLEQGATPEDVASLFNISVRRVELLGEGLIQVDIGGEIIYKPVKHGFEPEKIIKESEWDEHNGSDRGLTVVQQSTQLIRWLKKDLIAYKENNISTLAILRDELEKFFKRVEKKK